MTPKPLTMNMLKFTHAIEKLTVYLTMKPSVNSIKLSEKDANQLKTEYNLSEDWTDVYALTEPDIKASILVSKALSPDNCSEGESSWSVSFLKKYYTLQLSNYFKLLGLPCRTNFVSDTEVWVKSQSPYPNCTGYKAYTIRIQFNYEEHSFEMVVIVGELHSVYSQALSNAVFAETNSELFGWVLFETEIQHHKNMTEQARRNLNRVYPCLHPPLRAKLNFSVPAPDKSNRYLKHFDEMEHFKQTFLETEGLAAILLLNLDWKVVTPQLFDTTTIKILQFGEGKHAQPKFGMPQLGPKELITDEIVFLFIGHKDDKPLAMTIDDYFRGNYPTEFKGISEYLKMHYKTESHLSIWFSDKENPIPEIEAAIKQRKAQQVIVSSKRYVAIYLSPHAKTSSSQQKRKIYFDLKELLLTHGIVSQTLDTVKSWGYQRELMPVAEVSNGDKKSFRKALVKKGFHYSLANIAVAIYAKLGATPWCFEAQESKELVIGISAYTSRELGKKYIGSAFSFTNEGQFGGFECFSQHQISELAGSIKLAVKKFCNANAGINRLVIHFYKRLSYKDLKHIQNALTELKLDIPVVVVSINKGFSDDVVGFDMTVHHKMPISGNYLAINNKQYLLYNNQLTNTITDKIDEREGFPFPLKISVQKHLPNSKIAVVMSEEELVPIFEQVCQFSLLYWKSVSRQWLPVTLRYPEMLAQIAPHFKYKDWGELGSDSLWFI